jgi:putative endonuclease
MFPRVLLDRLLGLWKPRRGSRGYRGLRGVGQAWERLAETHLKRAGYRILDRNVLLRVGEIDFVARDGKTLCFIEVKGRHGTEFGGPAAAVTLEKQRRIFRAAEAYLQRHRPARSACRFDVVAILDQGGEPTVEILRGAFEGPVRPRSRR